MRRERFAARILRIDDPRMPRDQALYPFHIAGLDCMKHVADLDGKQAAKLAQIVNGPSSRRGTMNRVSRVQISACLAEKLDHRAVTVERRVMKRSCTVGIACPDQIRICFEEEADALGVTTIYRFEELGDVVHDVRVNEKLLPDVKLRQGGKRIVVTKRRSPAPGQISGANP